jgi:hypothetical protein
MMTARIRLVMANNHRYYHSNHHHQKRKTESWKRTKISHLDYTNKNNLAHPTRSSRKKLSEKFFAYVVVYKSIDKNTTETPSLYLIKTDFVRDASRRKCQDSLDLPDVFVKEDFLS